MKAHLPNKITCVCLVLLASLAMACAQSGTWTNDASSVWSATTNWLNNAVADGAGSTADFSTIDITANRTVTLDSSRSIGNLVFGDASGAQNWLLNPSAGSVLTLAGGTPMATVTNVATLTVPLGGTAGLTKAGPGTLVLGGTNSYSGVTTISAGTLQITNGPGGLMNGAGGLVLYFSFNKVSGTRVINEGSGGALMDGMLVGNGGVSIGASMGRFGDNCLNVTQGAVHNNNNVGYVGNGGYVLVNNAVVPFTVTSGNAAANWTLAMWIRTTVTGAAYMYQGPGGWSANGHTSFYLNPGTGGVGSGSRVGGVRWGQGWESGTATINDGNWHHIAMTCSAGTKTLYVDGTVDAFTANGNQWTGAGVGNQLWIGGTGGTPGDGNVSMVGQIDKVAVYNRPLSLAEIQSLTNNVVPGLVAPAIPLNSPVSVASGAKLDVNGYSATVTNLTGSGAVDTAISGGYLAARYDADTTFNGNITNSGAATLNFYKAGSGKLTLAGSAGNNATVIRQGTVDVTGTIVTNGANNTIIVADGAERAILNIPSSSTVIARNLVLGGLSSRGGGGGGAGAVYNTGTFKNFGNTGTGAFAIGNSTGGASPTNNGYGYFLHDSATSLTLGESGLGGICGGDGVFEVKSGTANFTNWITLGRADGTVAGSAQRSLMLVRNGTVMGPNRNTQGDGIRWNWSGSVISQISVMDIGAGGKLGSLPHASGAGANINMNQANNGSGVAILTLSGGGALEVYNVYSYNAAPLSIINLNNGTLSPAATFANFIGTGLDYVFVYAGGVTFDTKGFDAGVIPQLSAPSGNSITNIPVTGNGSGYIGRPIVQITDSGGGVGATAVAEWDQAAGTVTGITITAPGSGYASPTMTLVGGGYTTAATLGTPVLGAVASGGLTKTGSGTLTLAGGYTYTGTTVIQGGALSVAANTVTPATAGGLTLSNAALTVDVSSGTALPVGNLTLQNNATNNFNYGTVSANPSFPAINASGSISAPGAGLVINISAFGLKIGQFPLIKYTGTALSSIANFSLGTLPPGVTASLSNYQANTSIDLVVTATGQDLAWYGLDGVTGLINPNWGINAPTNWVAVGTTTPALRYQEYTSAGSTVGDPVTFDDTLYSDGTNPQATNINVTTTVRPFRFLVNNTLPYSFTGSGGVTGLGGIVKSNSGSLFLGTSNSYSGGTFVYGGTLIITNDTALGASASAVTLGGGNLQIDGSTTNNARAISVPTTTSIGVAANATARFGGAVTGAGGLTKIDSGTLVLAGSNSIAGNLIVSQGTLSTLGTNALPALVTVGDTAGVNAVLNISGGALQATLNGGNVWNSSLVVGSVAGAAGDLVLNSGTLSVTRQLALGAGNGAYAAYSQTGGSATLGGFLAIGLGSDQGVFNQSGGTFTLTANGPATIGAGTTTIYSGIGVVNLSGTAVFSTTNTDTSGGIFWVGETATGVLNMSGSSALILTNNGLIIGKGNGAGQSPSGTVNLNGGTLTTTRVFKSAGSGTSTLNFNGGTLKASAANAAFLTGLTSTELYSGGATIDDGGYAITIAQPLLAPTDYGVSSIMLSSGGSGYIDSPIVTISGGTGSNAMATATVSGGAVTTINVTCPGTGYSSSDSLSVSFSGGGGSVVSAVANAPVLAPAASGGLTKKGAGTLTLTGTNTFTGTVTNIAGTLNLSSASTYSSAVINGGLLFITTAGRITGSVTVTNGATYGISQIGTGTITNGNLTLGLSGTNGATLKLTYAGGNTATPLLTCGTLTLNGTNTVSIAGRFTVGTFPLVKYSGSILGSGIFNTNITAPQGVTAVLSNDASGFMLYAVITSTGGGLVWTGTNSNPALTNVWDLNATTNWLIGSTPTTYQETVPPGDAVTFNDSGSGLVIVSNTTSPFSMLVSNNAVAYAFQGPGHISGSAGLTKLGSGKVTIALTNNNYTGDTVVSNGSAVMGSGSALSGSANLNVGPLGTVDLADFSETVNGLSGSGVIANSGSAGAVVLTVGNANGGGTWNGTVSNAQTGGEISLTKTGSGTLVIGGTNRLDSGTASQVNGGTTIITNNALVSMATSEFWVAQGANTATAIVDGGTLITLGNWLVVGRANAAANGTLIVNRGTVQKAGANNIVVGSLGGTGTLIVNGGQVLNNGMLWLGEGSTANAYLYLNGGLIQASEVRPNNNGGLPVNSIAYFNGGTLQATASSTSFLQSQSMVMSNGVVLDDNGFTLSIGAVAFLDGDGYGGGLLKKGAGTVYLDTYNSYAGTTVVANGTLAGVGGISGPVVVAPAGNIGAGDAGAIGTLYLISQPLTLQGKATMRISKTGGTPASDLITGITAASYGGTLSVSNATSDATPLTPSDTFTLFSASAPSGNFTSIVGSPGPGLAYSFDPTNGVLSVVTGVASPTNITFSVSGSTLTLGWPAEYLGWYAQSNSVGVVNSNSWHDIPGSQLGTSLNITINPAQPNVFYRLRSP